MRDLGIGTIRETRGGGRAVISTTFYNGPRKLFLCILLDIGDTALTPGYTYTVDRDGRRTIGKQSSLDII